jgi:UPF0716 protein FxsA
MRLLLFLLFIAVPLIELALLIKIGEVIGVLATVALVIVTAVIGVSLLRMQGVIALRKAQEALQAGRPPIDSVIDGVCLLIAGAFLLTPGLLTDSVGFLLLVPQIRSAIARWAFAKLQQSGQVDVRVFGDRGGSRRRPPGPGPGPGPGPRPGGGQPSGPVIEGEFTETENDAVEPKKSKPRTGSEESPWRK